jgi:hypothetical protein
MAGTELAEPQKTKLWHNLEIANFVAIVLAGTVCFYKIRQSDTSYEMHRWCCYMSLASVICFWNIFTISKLRKRKQKT